MGESGFLEGLKKITEMAKGTMNSARVDQVLEQAHYHYGTANQAVRGILGSKYSVDEMALYFPEEGLLLDFIKQAVQKDWMLFNYAEDNVITRPIAGAYAVEYWFLRNEDFPYRLELLWLPGGEGFSPYHASLLSVIKHYRVPALAHASFKVPDAIEFGNAAFHLRQAGYDLLQHCESTYGQFSYFRLENDVPIKPRINVRDGGNGGN